MTTRTLTYDSLLAALVAGDPEAHRIAGSLDSAREIAPAMLAAEPELRADFGHAEQLAVHLFCEARRISAEPKRAGRWDGDEAFLATLIARAGPLSLADLEAGLALSLDVAFEAIETSAVRANTAARIFETDEAARAEFLDVGNLEGHLLHLANGSANAERRHVEPMTAEQVIALCRRTKHQVDGTVEADFDTEPAQERAAEPEAKPDAEAPEVAVPSLEALARRLGFTHGIPLGGLFEMLRQRGAPAVYVNRQLETRLEMSTGGLLRIVAADEERPTAQERADAQRLERDLLAYIEHHHPEALCC